MRAKGIKRKLDMVYKKVSKTISDNAKGGFYAAGLSTEGYHGGYRQAIMDVTAAIYGNNPNFPSTKDYWEDS